MIIASHEGPLGTNDTSFALGVARLTLTDAQIKALPSTPIEIVGAPGAGRANLMLRAVFSPSLVSPYTGIDTDNTLGIDNVEVNHSVINNAVDSILNLGYAYVALPGLAGITTPIPKASFENLPLRVFVSQDDTGLAYTGGNAANTLTVSVIYTVINV